MRPMNHHNLTNLSVHLEAVITTREPFIPTVVSSSSCGMLMNKYYLTETSDVIGKAFMIIGVCKMLPFALKIDSFSWLVRGVYFLRVLFV